MLKGYQAKRIFAVLDPENPALADIAYQQNKGAMAIGTGGLTGTGLWGEHVFVPNSWNDFIFSYLANAMGFVGAVTVLLLLLGISVRILLAALQSTDALGRYLCVGIFAALFWQCIINLGMNLQVLPVIGVTLPFFSAGGSSVVMVYLCVGLVLAVSRKNRRKKLAVPIELETDELLVLARLLYPFLQVVESRHGLTVIGVSRRIIGLLLFVVGDNVDDTELEILFL